MSTLFEVKDVDRRFYEERVRDFLPRKIIDAHTHIWLDRLKAKAEHGFARVVKWPSLVARENPIEDHLETYRLMFPDQEVTPLIFTNIKEGDDPDALNGYVRECASLHGLPSLLYASPEWSAEVLERKVVEGGFLGVKVYLNLAPAYIPTKEIRIFDFLPPVPFERRMWAGGRIQFVTPLHIGDEITRQSEIMDVAPKEGKNGPLVFVLVRHRITGPDGLAIEEEHDIVYRGDVPASEAPPPPEKPAAAPWQRVIEPDIAMLFRYSALIFNAHRIHYDRDYVTKEEGYPGLIVHGPLIATLLMDLCRRENPKVDLTRFDYRARGPIFDAGPFTVAGTPADDARAASLEARDHEGRVAMTAKAEFDR